MTVKMYKDGNRTVIVIEDGSTDLDSSLHHMIQRMLGGEKSEESVPLEEIEGLTPPPENNDCVPIEEIESYDSYSPENTEGKKSVLISDGKYMGMSAIQALNQDNEAALSYLFQYVSSTKDAKEKRDIIASCKQYMSFIKDTVALFDTRERKVQFIKQCISIFPKTENSFYNGYASLDTFVDMASDTEIDIALNSMASSMEERGLK